MTDTLEWPWAVRGSGKGGWWIDAGNGQPVNGKYYSDCQIAVVRAHHLENQARIAPRVKPRQCLCCATPFESTGAHHRLCGRCRLLA